MARERAAGVTPAPAPIESWEVLDLLTNLIQKSLVVYEEDEQGQGRYRLLETVRQYARDRLLDTREGEALRERHVLCFLALAEQVAVESESSATEQVVLLERLERELEARALFEKSLSISREVGHQNGIAWRLYHLGTVALSEGDEGTARAYLVESLALFQELGHKRGIVYGLEGLAAAAVAQGQWERTSRLVGAVSAVCEAIGASLPPADRAKHDHAIAAAHTALGEDAFAAAWAEGRTMTLDQAVSLALEEPDAA